MGLRRWFKSLPLPLLRNAFVLSAVGVLFIYSASFRTSGDYASRQMMWLG